MKPNVNC